MTDPVRDAFEEAWSKYLSDGGKTHFNIHADEESALWAWQAQQERIADLERRLEKAEQEAKTNAKSGNYWMDRATSYSEAWEHERAKVEELERRFKEAEKVLSHAKFQNFELLGVLIDVDNGGFDDACRKTVARVRGILANLPGDAERLDTAIEQSAAQEQE